MMKSGWSPLLAICVSLFPAVERYLVEKQELQPDIKEEESSAHQPSITPGGHEHIQRRNEAREVEVAPI